MYSIHPIGFIHSDVRSRSDAPRQVNEGAPDVCLEVSPGFIEGLHGIAPGDEIIVITWLHEAPRQTLQVHPRDDLGAPLAGVFSTRSAERPNPLGLHRVTVKQIEGNRLRIGPMEAIDGTPVVDIKPVLMPPGDS